MKNSHAKYNPKLKKMKEHTIGGVELSSEHWQILENGGFIYL